MCGLLGMVGPGIGKDDLAMFHDLAYVMGLRGMDSTGLIQGTLTNYREDLFIEKAAMDVGYYLWYHSSTLKGNKRVLNSVQDNTFMMHTRAATLGSINDYNAHPHVTKTLIGMHNGTLVDPEFQPKDDRTDSELLYKAITDRGPFDVLKNLDTRSAYALTWVNRSTKKISIIRNGRRPLYCAANMKRRVFYWASEAWMLEGCADRNGVDLTETWYFEPYQLHTFNSDDVRAGAVPNWKTESFKPEPKVEVPAATIQTPVLITGPKKEGEAVKVEKNPTKITADNSSFRIKGLQDLDKVVDLVSRPEKSSLIKKVEERPGTPEYKRTHPRKIEHQSCKYCQRDLNLYGQYMATPCAEDHNKTVVCEDCTKRIKELAEEKDLKTANSIII